MTLSEYRVALGAPTYLYGNATSALKDYLAFLHRVMPDKSTILLPSYICANVYSAILALGFTVRFFDIDDRLDVDLRDVEKHVDSDTLALLWVHFFGKESRTYEARAFADRRGIVLIEDCAHTISADAGGRLIGTIGHAAIFSLWKTMRTADGGMLVVNAHDHASFTPQPDSRPSELRALRGWTSRQARRAIEFARGKPLARPESSMTPTFSVDVEAAKSEGVARMSRVSRFWVSSMHMTGIREKRRKNFRFWQESVRRFPSLTPMITHSPEGFVPFSYPVVVNDGARDDLRRKLWTRGVLCGAGFPEAPFEDGHPDARMLSDSLLELPVHQEVTSRDLRIAEGIISAWQDAISPTASSQRKSP